MAEFATRAQVAARFGVSRQRVEELMREGRLSEGPGGIDLAQADAVFAGMDPSYKLRAELARDEREVQPTDGAPANSYAQQYNKAKAAEQVLKTRQRQLDLQIREGRFVDREKVKQTAYSVGKVFASRCENMASRLAPRLVGMRDAREVHEIIQAEMTALVQEIRDELAGLG